MKLEVIQSVVFPAPPDRVWALLLDIQQMEMFVGWGPIPGIVDAKRIQGTGSPGSVRAISNRDGSTHKEEVMELVQLKHYEDRIFDLTSPLRLMVHDVRDRFALEADGAGTRLNRTFTFELSSVLWWPAAMLIRSAMGVAVTRHHAEIARRLG